MPLPAAAPRDKLHRRVIHCEGFAREDGLWDIEGHITDTKSYEFHNEWRGGIAPGVAVHDMWLRLTLDDDFVVRMVDVAFDATPFPLCGDIAGAYQQLVGLTLGPGWSRAVRSALGGRRGCTHVTELLGPMATVAFQTIIAEKRRRARAAARNESEQKWREKPPFIDGCHAWVADGEVVRRFLPEFYKGGGE